MENSIFNSTDYKAIDTARFEHLAGLEIPLKGKTILELGAGIGNHTENLKTYSPKKIICVEGREQNLAYLQQRFAKHKSIMCFLHNLELGLPDLSEYKIDVVYNFGLLYHLSNPEKLIKDLAKLKHDTMILETCVSTIGELNPTLEPASNVSQALDGVGCRPSLDYLTELLNKTYEFVEVCKTQPNHPQFDVYGVVTPEQLKRVVIVCRKVKAAKKL
jgi:2-polyprenyl-3-methyl-5-hydroxy-6-metoxy-1,4-benzoquinol methylase